MFEPKDVAKLAQLARIKVSPAEEEKLAKDINSILSYVSTIENVNAGDEEPSGLINVMREDGEPHASGAYTDILLAALPRRAGDHAAVKKVISR